MRCTMLLWLNLCQKLYLSVFLFPIESLNHVQTAHPKFLQLEYQALRYASHLEQSY